MGSMNSSETRKQSGFVSIIVASLIMIVLALITIGFTRIMQREQRQSLDRQLSRQALYAAESGINDVFRAIADGDTGFEGPDKTECDVSGLPNNGHLDGIDGDIQYTCATYDKAPGELVYDLAEFESKIVQLQTDNGKNFQEITIRWGNSDSNNNGLPNCSFAGSFGAARPGSVPIIKVDLTSTAQFNREALINSTDYLYLLPCQGGSGVASISYSPNQPKGRNINVACNTNSGLAHPCELTIRGINTSDSYLARIKAIYSSASLTISGIDIDNDAAKFEDAQISIDVTARSNDIVKRLRVSAPYSVTTGAPESVFHVFNGVCKKLEVNVDTGTPDITDSCIY